MPLIAHVWAHKIIELVHGLALLTVNFTIRNLLRNVELRVSGSKVVYGKATVLGILVDVPTGFQVCPPIFGVPGVPFHHEETLVGVLVVVVRVGERQRVLLP